MKSLVAVDPNNLKVVFPLGWFTQSVWYSPSQSANHNIYRRDREFFGSHKERWLVIRKELGEFQDIDNVVRHKGSLLFVPQLWVLVSRHPSLGHHVIPVWRGSISASLKVDAQGYLLQDGDAAVQTFLSFMASSRGLNEPEWARYNEKLLEAQHEWNAVHGVANPSGSVN